MNEYIAAQIANMEIMVDAFKKSCLLAATKDNGKIDRDEAKTLKNIEAATKRFMKELKKLK